MLFSAFIEVAKLSHSLVQDGAVLDCFNGGNWQTNYHFPKERPFEPQRLRCLVGQANVKIRYLPIVHVYFSAFYVA